MIYWDTSINIFVDVFVERAGSEHQNKEEMSHWVIVN